MQGLFGSVCPCCGQQVQDAWEGTFEEFWRRWPDKRAKHVAQKAWARLAPAERKVAADRCASWCRDWRKHNKEASHILASTYLNQRRFLDGASAEPADAADALAVKAKWIAERKAYLARSIPPAQVREMVTRGLVTPQQCREAGL
jgi:hypothetical protein